MEAQGVICDGVVKLDTACPFPEGSKVIVRLNAAESRSAIQTDSDSPASPLAEMLLRHAGKAQGLPEDLAAQHDHYLYGTPKR